MVFVYIKESTIYNTYTYIRYVIIIGICNVGVLNFEFRQLT